MIECVCCGDQFPADEVIRARMYDRNTGELLPEDQWAWISIDHFVSMSLASRP
jgi:hypothetical protein